MVGLLKLLQCSATVDKTSNILKYKTRIISIHIFSFTLTKEIQAFISPCTMQDRNCCCINSKDTTLWLVYSELQCDALIHTVVLYIFHTLNVPLHKGSNMQPLLQKINYYYASIIGTSLMMVTLLKHIRHCFCVVCL